MAGTGAAIGSAIAGPGGAAVGGAVGVAGAKLIESEVEGSPGIVSQGPAGVVHEVTSLTETLIWGAIVFLVIIPFLTGKGRKGISGGLRTVFGNSAPKKWVTENFDRLNKHEEVLKNLEEKTKL